MKTNYISDAAKILIFAATIIIVCVLCAIGFKTANEGKSVASSGTSQLNAMSSEYQDVNKSIYDGSTILGSELVNLITKAMEKKDYLAIVVETKSNAKHSTSPVSYNYTFNDSNTGTYTLSEQTSSNRKELSQSNKGSDNYINPSAQFLGKVYKDANNNVICIEFAQQD